MTSSIPPLRIFVVENHADTLKWLSFYLEDGGHTILAAKTMAEALDSLPKANADVLISDIGLPDGDGWELLEGLHQDRPPYAIAISGAGMMKDRARSEAAGFQRHLVKPLDLEELEEALEEASRDGRACSQ